MRIDSFLGRSASDLFSISAGLCIGSNTNWPKKNIIGKQELEIRVGNDHIAFEVRFICPFSDCPFSFNDSQYYDTTNSTLTR